MNHLGAAGEWRGKLRGCGSTNSLQIPRPELAAAAGILQIKLRSLSNPTIYIDNDPLFGDDRMSALAIRISAIAASVLTNLLPAGSGKKKVASDRVSKM